MIMKNYSYLDENGQVSAEMILLIGALLIIVILAGYWVLNMTNSIAGNISEVIDTAADTTIGKM